MSSVPTTLLSQASEAWKMLSGIVCLYKPLGYTATRAIKELKKKICDDLNQLKPSPRAERVEILRLSEEEKSARIPLENEKVLLAFHDGQKKLEVVKGLSMTDHPLITGPKFKMDDIKVRATGRTSANVSGVHVYGINRGTGNASLIYQSRWLRTYLVSGQFGIATDNYFHNGRVLHKATYGKITRPIFQRCLASSESSHQRLSFLASGAPLDSERAYELASQGLVRPERESDSVVYSIKCVDFNLPNFTIEVKSVNEDPYYLQELIHRIGLHLRSVAVCTKIQCTNVGPFTINDALLLKHWTLEHVLNNMKNSREILKDFNLKRREVWVDKPLEDVHLEESDDDDEDEQSENKV